MNDFEFHVLTYSRQDGPESHAERCPYLRGPTRELGPHDPGYHATSGVPYGYDPEALAPTWGRFLGDFVDAETAHFLQEVAGYALTTDVSHELVLWLYGTPGGGRSTFIAGLEAMLGERAGTLGLGEVERSRFALADVPGKTLLTATERPAGYMKASYVLNALISGDKMKVEEKFKSEVAGRHGRAYSGVGGGRGRDDAGGEGLVGELAPAMEARGYDTGAVRAVLGG